jgi:hypothetical protein
MKKSKFIKSLMLLSIVLFFATIGFTQTRPPHDPCWDMGSLDNWGNWDPYEQGRCHGVMAPSEIKDACWRGCTNADLDNFNAVFRK